jgi:hypothetical protein
MRTLAVVVALLAALSSAQAQTGSAKTTSQLNAEVGTTFPDNTTGVITPFNMRQFMLDLIASGASAPTVGGPCSVLGTGLACGTGGAGGGGGAVVVSSASALASATLAAAVTAVTAQNVTGTGFIAPTLPTCPLTYLKGTTTATGVYGEVLNTASATYWEPQYQATPVLACQFGAWGDNSHDDIIPLQAMIDWGFAAGNTQFQLQSGANYLISSALFLDPPGNLRTNLANPTNFSFSMSLKGGDGPGLSPAGNATIWANFTTGCILWIGPGQGMSVSGLIVRGPMVTGSNVHRGLPPNGVSFCVATGNGGATRTLLDNINSYDSYKGIWVGANGNPNLGDSTTIRKCNIRAAVAVQATTSNAFINRMEECVIEASTDVVVAGNGMTVSGGNFSAPNLLANTFTINTVSSATANSDGTLPCEIQTPGVTVICTNYQLTVTATIANPDAIMNQGVVYDGFVIKTPSYGLVPLSLISYNSTSHVAVFRALDAYMAWNFNGFNNDPAVSSNILDEINASTTLYAAERNIVFAGSLFAVNSIHIENGSVPTTLLQDAGSSTAGADGAAINTLSNIKINGDWTNGTFAGLAVVAGSASPAVRAQYYVARAFPQMWISSSSNVVENLVNLDPSDDMALIDQLNPSFGHIIWRSPAPRQMYRSPINSYAFTSGTLNNIPPTGVPPAFGGGEFDSNPFLTTAVPNRSDTYRGAWGMGRVPMQGVRPAQWSNPMITPGFATLWQTGPLPALALPANANVLNSTPATVGYPLMYGGQVYQLADWYTGVQTNYRLISNHHFWSYGQNLPAINWSYRGSSSVLNVSDTRLFFPGLGIAITCVGIAGCPTTGSLTGLQILMVTGVYPALGYITVLRGNETENGPWQLLGVKGTTYSGTLISSEPYAITRF